MCETHGLVGRGGARLIPFMASQLVLNNGRSMFWPICCRIGEVTVAMRDISLHQVGLKAVPKPDIRPTVTTFHYGHECQLCKGQHCTITILDTT